MQPLAPHDISLDRIHLPGSTGGPEIFLLRLDRIHPLIPGNKWFKLRLYLDEAKRENKKRICTAGGPWSNHLLATAAASRLFHFACTGIIRGERPKTISPVLEEAARLGMNLVFLSREDFAARRFPEGFDSGENYYIPAGGYGKLGVLGAAGILDHCRRDDMTHICCAAGTGTMGAGLLYAATPAQRIILISVLKNNLSLEEDLTRFVPGKEKQAHIIHRFHFGGYAKYDPTLLDFMNELYRHQSIPTDFVYTGKLLYGISRLCEENYFDPESRLLLIHSGGLAGNASLKKGTLIF